MKRNLLFLLSCFVAFISSAQTTPTDSSKITLKNLTDSGAYSLGYNIGQTVTQRFSFMDKAIIFKALNDAIENKPSAIDVNLANNIITACMQQETDKASAGNIAEGKAFLAENKKKPGVIETSSGLQYKVIKQGTGAKPTGNDQVKVNYEGRFIDGKVFDGSALHGGTPAQFGVNGVIAGWTEALKLMQTGSKFQVYIPSTIGYGNQGSGQIKPGQTLIFDMELVEVVKQAAAAPGKPNVQMKPTTKPVVKGRH